MPRIRFSLATLMAIVSLTALSLVALRNASALWANTTFTITLTLLLCALLGLIHRRHHARAFWLGFAVFGWAYFVLVNAPWLATHVGPRLITDSILSVLHENVFSAQVDALDYDVKLSLDDGTKLARQKLRLAVGTGRILRLKSRIRRVQVLKENLIDLNPLPRPNEIQLIARASGSTAVNLWDENDQLRTVDVTVDGPNLVQIRQVGHSLFALLFALLGSYVARCFYAKDRAGYTGSL